MEFLNQNSTKVFGQLLAKLDEGYVKIINEPFMPLSMENIAWDIETPWGIAELYSICHYCIQNGDQMQDPEMCFIVIDGRSNLSDDYDNLKIAPYMFQQANPGIYEESVIIHDSKVTAFRRKQQKDHTMFANEWLSNIEQQGFLK